MRDVMGQAIWDFYHNDSPEDILTETTISEMDVMSVAYLFRAFDKMNLIEKKAMELTHGKVLDVGAGAGAHSLYLQNERKLRVTALEVSPKSSEVCRLRGIEDVRCQALLDFPTEKFDTILLLMNGTGIFENLKKITLYLKKLHELLSDDGQILIDSTDVIYMYNELDSMDLPLDRYYGEVKFHLFYKGTKEKPFPWLFLDYNLFKKLAEQNHFKVEKIMDVGPAYLARLQKSNLK